MIQNIPIEAVIGAVTVISGIAIAAYRRGTFTVSDDIDGDGEDETFDADFTDGDDETPRGHFPAEDGTTTNEDQIPEDEDPTSTADPAHHESGTHEGPVDEEGDPEFDGEDTAPPAQNGDVQTSPDFSNDEYSELTDITGIGPTKAEALGQEAGISSPADVWYASDDTLTEATGVGPSVVEQIRDDIGGIDYQSE